MIEEYRAGLVPWIGQPARVERRLWFVGIDALRIIVGYGLGMYLLFSRGIALG